jgi:hypothetical protein
MLVSMIPPCKLLYRGQGEAGWNLTPGILRRGVSSMADFQVFKEWAYIETFVIPEKKPKGRRDWQGQRAEQQAVYENRRRVRGKYGKSLLRRRGELIERSFAHCYETGGMRRCHLRGRENILKRQLVHVGAFNLSLILRKLLGAGTPRELKNRAGQVFSRLLRSLSCWMAGVFVTRQPNRPTSLRLAPSFRCRTPRHRLSIFRSSATGC